MIVKIIIIIIIIITSVTRMMVMMMILTTMITQHQFCKIGALKVERSYFAEFFLREKTVKSSFIAILQFIIIFLRIDSLSGTTKMKKRRFNNA